MPAQGKGTRWKKNVAQAGDLASCLSPLIFHPLQKHAEPSNVPPSADQKSREEEHTWQGHAHSSPIGPLKDQSHSAPLKAQCPLLTYSCHRFPNTIRPTSCSPGSARISQWYFPVTRRILNANLILVRWVALSLRRCVRWFLKLFGQLHLTPPIGSLIAVRLNSTTNLRGVNHLLINRYLFSI